MIAKSGPLKNESRKLLLEIFEQGKEWRKAIEIAETLASGTETEHFEEAISQYHCELAEEYLGSNRFDDARSALSDAMGHDARNARVSLLVGKLEFEAGEVTKKRSARLCVSRISERSMCQNPLNFLPGLMKRQALTHKHYMTI